MGKKKGWWSRSWKVKYNQETDLNMVGTLYTHVKTMLVKLDHFPMDPGGNKNTFQRFLCTKKFGVAREKVGAVKTSSWYLSLGICVKGALHQCNASLFASFPVTPTLQAAQNGILQWLKQYSSVQTIQCFYGIFYLLLTIRLYGYIL